METYPGELLVGVFPLVFCVDATQAKAQEGDKESNEQYARSQFDRFLDAMAASLLNELPDDPSALLNDDNTMMASNRRKKSTEDVMMALFRGDEGGDEDSGAEDDLILGGTSANNNFGTSSSFDGSAFADADAKRSRSFGFLLPGKNNPRSDSATISATIDISFAKALQEGQGFFQRARIVSIGTRHGFPPSKDPTGDRNRIHQFLQGKTLQTTKLLAATKKRPIDGILPSGWLQKHAAALPSVILVVVQITQNKHQPEQDGLLLETLENLQESLAAKRNCTIQIVGLVQEGVSRILADQWSQAIADKLDGQPLTLLQVADLQQDATPSIALEHLHKSVRDASLQYYLTQARRTKHKLFQLGPARETPLLLPLSIRYCFKVAMLYEFQWKPEKSLKFLVEAYRHVETYYRYLLQQRRIGTTNNDNPSSSEDPLKIRVSNHTSAPTEDTEEGGVELSLQSPASRDDEDMKLLLKPPTPPSGMVHQCRAVADWLNFKILQAGLTSHTEGGLLAASSQWQKHTQVFCSPRRSFVCSPDHAYMDWSFVAHQRMVVSQLLERNPPKALGNLGHDFDEVLLRCSNWRTYQAAAEAFLRLGAEVQKALSQLGDSTEPSEKVDEMRTLYVGGLDDEGYTPKLQEEAKINQREQALDCILRSISLYERDVKKAQKDEFQVLPWNRSGARMHYLAGSTLLGLERHAEAMPYLEIAAKLSKGWNGLELVIRRMLIECYEKHMPSEAGESSHSLASLLLDSYFNAEMSNSDLRRALEKFSALSGGGTIQWYRNCMDEADATLPFSFALTFPSTTHATAGDGVKASVLIKSNLDYAVHVNSVTLLSLAGQISIPSMDLMSAHNANEGSDGGIIIQANTEILLSTQIKLPKDLEQIATDETGNGGEKEGVAGKGSFAKSARPRTGGITAAAGGRLVSEELFGDAESRAGNSQWSLKCLGGKPLRCDGLRLVFYPVYSAAISEGENTEIELTIEKKQPKTETEIKRTPFEEDNYIASAWMRPRHLPMNRGPRCLRVLPPMADMIVTNLTEPCTNGKVLEGTVNRVLLRLKAGSNENCTDVKLRVSCSSLLISIEGKTKRITAEPAEDKDEGSVADIQNPRVRTPVLVMRDENAKSQMTEFGYEIPAGWALVGDGQGIRDGYTPVVSTLTSGESTYAYFDVFRPSPQLTRMAGVVQIGEDAEDLACEHDLCQTDIDVFVCYRQDRPAQKMKQIPTRRRNRKKPGEDAGSAPGTDENESDLVFLEQSMNVFWSSPISAVFSPGLKETQPSGNRHPSNTVPDPAAKSRSIPAATQSEMVLIDRERVSTKCTLEAVASADGLTADIEEIRFEDTIDEHAPCTFKLLSGKNEDGLLYTAQPEDPCRKLILGSKFSLAWMAEVNMKSNYLKGSVSASLGLVSVDWLPTTLKLPEEVTDNGYADSITTHGPLRLMTPSTCRFMGPPCYIENAPFEAAMDGLPESLRVATPFDVTYQIKNKTSLDQKLRVILNDAEPASDESHGFLVSGLVNGEISVGPFETHTLSYTALATRAGKIWMPQVCVSSDRYKTWIIKESQGSKRSLFVVP